ncbi:MAG: CHRD domain-containing protein, partial [Saprospiraceae bacterium]|nr:CHRD domain-containing protein [Saprospiraceae bacterium]
MLWSPRMHAQICGNGFSADFSCGQGVSIDVVGAGAFGNASTTVAVPGDLSSVDSIFVEVMFKGEVTSTFADITIETDGGDTCVLSPTALTNVGSSEKGAAYRTVVGPASQVTANVSTSAPDNTNEVQSVTLFVVRSDQECSQGATGQSGILIFHACDTLEFGNIEAGAQPRDLQLTIPISELGSATLPAILEITLLDNGIVYDMYRDTLYGIPDNIGNFLTIYDTTFSNVPGTLDSVSIAFISPGIGAPIDESCEFGNGDSFIVGTVILSIACDVGACCEITCSNPPNDTLQCLTDLPPVPANLLDSIGAVNGMGQSLDSIAFVDTVGGTFSHGFCDFFITLADSDTVGSGCVADPYIVTRTYDILFDSSGVFLLDTFCTHTFVVFDTTAPMIICPADITVECNTSTAPAATGMATATDNCGGTPTITFSDAVSVGACPQESTIARTWTATDNCGNSTSCVQIITVDDSIPPSITCPADVTIACTDTPDPATTGMATATDNCSTPSITYSDAVTPGECPQESTIIRTWLATDACGNSTTCTQTISIEDTVPPAITCPADVTIECDASTDPVDTGIATSSDNCDSAPGITYSDAATPGSCAGESTLIRTWVATDACGNSTTCTQTITLVDTTPPSLTCPADVTIECDDDSSPANTGIATAIDNCDPAPMVTYSESVAPGSCPNERTITRTWVATDACGNSTSCVQTIEVVDTTPPSITAPADATVECIDDVTFAPPTVSDNCDSAPMVTFTDMSGDLVTGMLSGAQEVPPAATPATGTVTGGYDPLTQMFFVVAEFSGLTGTLTAAHVHGPAAAGMNAGVQIPLAISTTGPGSGRAEGSATLTAQQAQDLQNGLWYVNVHTTAFPGGEVRAQLSVSSCDDVVKRTYTATDACGNTSTANAFVFVSDITAPIITCPADVTIECDEDSSPAATGMATATDNCDPAPGITFSDAVTIGSCPQASTIQRTWTATDACGNSTSCVQLISIVDTTPPMISCPADVTVECDESTDPANTGMATATDNCDTAPFVTFSDAVTPGACPQEGTITRTWTATDACGNSTSCVQLITIDDTTPPVIVCPADVTVECTDSTDPMDTGMATATDNCDGAPFVTYTDDTAPGTCPQESTITRTWTATDACGNSTSCVQTITVDDSTPPMISCPPDATIECATDATPALTGMATATDNCDPAPFVTYADGAITGVCPITFTRTWTATDACGNSTSCIQLITLEDTTPPMISCPADVTVECDTGTDPASTGMATATDNCDGLPGLTYSDASTLGNCAQESIIIRTWTATDICGNTATCLQTITVVDTTPPSLTCPADVTVECDESTDPVDTGIATATDNCDSEPFVTYSDVTTPGTCPQENTILRTWTATDACGNSTSCLQTISVVDTTPPTITVPADATVECIGDVAFDSAAATDNCDPSPAITFADMIGDLVSGSLSGDQEVPPAATPATGTVIGGYDPGTQMFFVLAEFSGLTGTLTAAHVHGPAAAGMNAGVQIPLNIVSTGGGSGYAEASATLTAQQAQDLLDGLWYVNVHTTAFPGGEVRAQLSVSTCDQIVKRTFTATDACGNSATDNAFVTVSDITPPMITCPADATIECATDATPAITGMATAADNCDPAPFVTYTDGPISGVCPITFTRTWTATDACGNSTSCVQNITLDDTTPPMITCPADVTVECDDSTDPANTGVATATDNCDVSPMLTYSDVSTISGCPQASTILRTWTATDICGNTATCVQTINVVDTTPPTITCPADVTVECTASTDPADTGFATAADNCDSEPFVTYSDVTTPGACPQESTITRTWTATDACGNSTSCVQTITVDDSTPPTIICPMDITIECDASTDPADIGMASAIDNCDNSPFVTYSDAETPGACAQEGTITRTWTATDACGNSTSCVQTITLVDTTPPMVTCPGDAEVMCVDEAIPANTGMPIATDNCDPAPFITYTDGPMTGQCPISFVRSWTIIDACGNSVTCAQNILVNDITPPVIVCPADATIECSDVPDPGVTGVATATDNCDPNPSVTYSDGIVSGQCPASFVRTWTATDICGNTSTCTQTITLEDTTPPDITCPPDVTVECDASTDPADTGMATATDNCTDAPAITYSDVVAPGACANESTITRTWTATDICGNTST